MRSLTVLIVSAFAFAATATSTFANDDQVFRSGAFTPDTLSWNGAYAGVHLGHGWARTQAAGTAIDGVGLDGWFAGLQAGYNINLDGFVLGIEGDIAWSRLYGDFLLNPGETMRPSIDWLGTIRARAGFSANELLVYGTGGIAFAGASVSNVESDYASRNTHTGWVIGAGIEAMVTDSLSLKAEYLYHDFGSRTYVYDAPFGASFNPQTIKIGLNYHF